MTHAPLADELLRIFVVYVGQGDGILIQLPRKYGYDIIGEDRREQIDILIDGGSWSASDADRIQRFVRNLYGVADPVIEYCVITHHDLDHVQGLTTMLEDSDCAIQMIFHNGLASFNDKKGEFNGLTAPPTNAVFKWSNGRLSRGMGFYDDDLAFQSDYIVNNKTSLLNEFTSETLQGVYFNLAEAIEAREDVNPVFAFDRAGAGRPFVREKESVQNRGVELTDVSFDVLWPPQQLRKYGDWGETINGNSVTFRLQYGDFAMLFTGDHNEKSEEALVDLLEAEDRTALLSCDVLKVPHHGSSHATERFFRHELMRPVVSVASMGDRGFSTSWKHPSDQVIKWLGGAHRVYHTHLNEKRFSWAHLLENEDEMEDLVERSNILIETDGRWFRVVELPFDAVDPNDVPTVAQTRRGNGTRWIRAR